MMGIEPTQVVGIALKTQQGGGNPLHHAVLSV
ncbi:hypothetical protein BDD21_3560 [Thiocapsa rosea]|uniref:Uncharacterized protein n=1 Tax=Thiocapsa rosea TaxID=69360 RepID=A0A495VBQ0_9GAMM|nr:hypothetical protein BDD21_3560 [Thiocapsa rosea]